MREIEAMLSDEKHKIDEMEVPSELEGRLSKALNGENFGTKKSGSLWAKAAAVCLIVMLLGYNFNTLAFYGQRLIGYDNIMNGTLKQLNELGKGQTIDKSYTFGNGVIVTLNGIMIDENQLLAFYSIKDPAGMAPDISISPYFKGAVNLYHQESGQGEISEDNKEIKWITSFKALSRREKTLEFRFSLSGRTREGSATLREEGKITFDIDRDKAMGHTLKKNIDKTFKVGGTKVKFESLKASPTQTILTGSVQGVFELFFSRTREKGISPRSIEVKLIANDREVVSSGGGMSTDHRGITFKRRFDTLPPELNSLKIRLEGVVVGHQVKEQVSLTKQDKNKKLTIYGQDIEVNHISEIKGYTLVTITSEESTVLTKVLLNVDGSQTELENTVDDIYTKQEDGSILHTRTLRFPRTGQNYELLIKNITYTKVCNEEIDIPVN